jgi:opacity protein-like surface antigen
MKIRLFFVIVLAMTVSVTLKSQEEFKPEGKAFADIYFNYHSRFTENNTVSTFEIQRAYFGYKYQLSKEFSTKINFDVGKAEVELNDSTDVNTSLEMTAFIKNAALTYKKDNLTIDAGVIGLLQHKIQEKIWDHRYIYKSFQDEYKISHSADLGVQVQYKIMNQLEVDFVVRNGEGYKKISNSDNAFRTGVGFTLTPVKGFIIRGYYDYQEKEEAQTSVSHFIAYKTDNLRLGAEYSFQLNYKDAKDHTLGGLSVFAGYDVSDKVELFGRYDMLTSNTLDAESESWNYNNDGSFIIGGIQYSPLKNIRIALDYQGWIPVAGDENTSNSAYLNFRYAF